MRSIGREIDFYLAEIDAWRSGEKATPGLPMDGERYPLVMRETIKDLERKIEGLSNLFDDA